MKIGLKAGALIALGAFLYARFFTGKLLFYINERFVWLTFAAAIGLILVGISYRYRPSAPEENTGHSHGAFSWWGVGLIILPVALGLLVPPKPLGAGAMANRDVSLSSLTSATAPEENAILTRPRSGEPNIMDWLVEFRDDGQDLSRFEGQEANLIGFVYRDERFGSGEFMVSRFVLSCCAADASPLGLIVRWPDSDSLADDQWVRVRGHFELGRFAGEELPLLIAGEVAPTETPDQPYLYPY